MRRRREPREDPFACLTERELDSTVRKPADAERYRVEQEAEGRKNSAILTAEAQRQATVAADAMLGASRNDATGQAGDALSGLLAHLRGFDPGGGEEKPGLLSRLMGRAPPFR